MTWTIRTPTAGEHDEILTVVDASFGGEGDATAIVRRTWEINASPPELELVAVHENAIIGHVLAAPGRLGGSSVVAIAPLAVAPSWQHRGVGSKLMRELLHRAEVRGSKLVLVLGDPAYYSRFGFVPAGPLRITYPPAGLNSPYFMVRILVTGEHPQGDFTYCWEPLHSAI